MMGEERKFTMDGQDAQEVWSGREREKLGSYATVRGRRGAGVSVAATAKPCSVSR